MNRIYQGRVTGVELVEDKVKKGKTVKTLCVYTQEEGEQLLWAFHDVFQDAVNYYLLALGALADPDYAEGHRLIYDFRARLEAAWEVFPRQGECNDAKSLRDSVAPWLDLEHDATLDDAFKVVLRGDEADGRGHVLALYSLLKDLTGASKIQQGGRDYLPYFCVADTKANFPRSSAKRLKEEGKIRLPAILWNETDSDSEESIRALRGKLCMDFFALPTTDGKWMDSKKVLEKLKWAVRRLCEQGKLKSLSSWEDKIQEVQEPKLRSHGAVNKDALKDRFAAWLVFEFLEQSPKLSMHCDLLFLYLKIATRGKNQKFHCWSKS